MSNIYKAFENLSTESILLYGISKDINSALRYLDYLQNIKIATTGDDLLNMGIKPSPKYQEIFDKILIAKLKNPEMTKNDELKLIF